MLRYRFVLLVLSVCVLARLIVFIPGNQCELTTLLDETGNCSTSLFLTIVFCGSGLTELNDMHADVAKRVVHSPLI